MGANLAEDKASLSRAKMEDEINCRKRHVLKETLGHILGQCASTTERIARYDEIEDFVLRRKVENDKDASDTTWEGGAGPSDCNRN
jgi:hypothetical protein